MENEKNGRYSLQLVSTANVELFHQYAEELLNDPKCNMVSSGLDHNVWWAIFVREK